MSPTPPRDDGSAASIYALVHGQLQFSPELATAIETTVAELKNVETSASRPGMLLGKVQSGKTRAFIGVMALAFDEGFDVAVVLTKATRALARQTVRRLQRDFAAPQKADLLEVYDVLPLPSPFTDWEAERKIIFVCKKQVDNLNNLRKMLLTDAYHLKGKRVLFVDDEADYASVGFRRTKGEIEVAKIASMIDELRADLKASARPPAFLQVTATPYALYLQPETFEIGGKTYERVRPIFTTLVPVHPLYVGGDFFFDEDHPQREFAARCFHEIADPDELEALKGQDGRRVKQANVLTAKSVATARSAVVQFVVAGAIRRIQQSPSREPPPRYAFIAHTETMNRAHKWQEQLFKWIVGALHKEATSELVHQLVEAAIDNLAPSVQMVGGHLPDRHSIHAMFGILIKAVKIEVVNSEKDIETLLDDEGQLRLASPLNLFIGGQILDRGITIANLIGFFYGRRPKRFQQDTVLQHARIFGVRPHPDLAITRIYTTGALYNMMRRLHEIDATLRDAFEEGRFPEDVIFVQRDPKGEIIPCAPNKISISTVQVVRPHRRLLPKGFNTLDGKQTREITTALDKEIRAIVGAGAGDELHEPKLVDTATVLGWLRRIEDTLEFEDGYEFDWGAMRTAIHYLASNKENTSDKDKNNHPGHVHVIVRTGRSIVRERKVGVDGMSRFSDAPDTSQREGKIARELASGLTPTLILIQQKGEKEKGWRGCPFWWPVLVPPAKMKPIVYAERTVDEGDAEADEA